MPDNGLPDWYPDSDQFVPNARDLADQTSFGAPVSPEELQAHKEDAAQFQYGLRSGQRLSEPPPRPAGIFQYGLRSGQFNGQNFDLSNQPLPPVQPQDFYGPPYQPEPPQPTEEPYGPQFQQDTAKHRADVIAQIQARDAARATGLEPFLPHETLSPLDKLLLGAGRGLESAASRIAGTGEAAARVLGSTGGRANRVSEYFGQMGESAQREAQALQNPESGPDAAGWVGEQVGGFIPLVLSSLVGGLPGFVAAGAIQAGGGAYKRAQANFSANGDDDTQASLKALPVGIMSGGINALITKTFAPDGTVGQALENGLTKLGLSGIVKSAAEAAGLGAGWGGSEALSQDLIERFADNPNKSVGEIVTDTLSGTAAGAGLGLSMAGLHGAGRKIIEQFRSEPQVFGPKDQRTMDQVVPPGPELSDQQTRYTLDPTTGLQREVQNFPARFAPNDVQISQAGDAFLKMPSGKSGINILNRMGLITDEEMFDVGDPTARLKIFGNVADRLEADGLAGLVDDKGRTVSTKVLRGQLPSEPTPESGEFQQAQGEQSGPVQEPEMPQPQTANVQAAGLRRGLQISDQSIQPSQEVSNAITPWNGQENIQQQRKIGDGQVQGDGPDRNIPTSEQASGAPPEPGNSVQPATSEQIAQPAPESPLRGVYKREAKRIASESHAEELLGEAESNGKTVSGIINDFETKWPTLPADVRSNLRLQLAGNLGFWDGNIDKNVLASVVPGVQINHPSGLVDPKEVTKQFGKEIAQKAFQKQREIIRNSFNDKTLFEYLRNAIQADRIDQLGGLDRGSVSLLLQALQKGGESNAKEERRQQEGLLNQTVPGAEIAPALAPTTKSVSTSSSLPVPQADIIDYIRDNIGLIKGKGTAKAGTEGYYGPSYRDLIQKHGVVRKLFTNKGRGVSPDEVVHDLREAGYLNQNANWDDVIDLLDKAGLQLKGQAGGEQSFNREIEEQSKQREDFEKALQPRLRPTTAVHTANLLVGDEFKLFGEKVTVKNLLFDPDTDHLAYVELEDGRRFGTQLVGAEHVLHVDHDSYHENPEATEFLPKSDRHKSADEIRAINEQINELRDKEKLTTEDHRRLQLLEQELGQKMMAFTEPQAVADDAAREAARQAKLAQMPRGNLELSGETIQPGQQSLFELNIPPVGSQFRKAIEQFAAETPFTSFQEFRDKVAGSSLPVGIKRSMLAFMDTPGIRDLNWRGFFFALGRGLPEGSGGFVEGNKLAVDQGNARTTTLPHEVSHLLWEGIPPEMQQAIERARVAEIRAKYGANAPEALINGTITSEEFSSSGLDPSDYRLTTPQEYFGKFVGNEFAKDFLDKEYPNSGIWQKIKDWFQALWQAIKQHFIRTPEGEQAMKEVYDQMMTGRYEPKAPPGKTQASFYESGLEAERAAELTEGTAFQKTEAAHALAQGTDFVRIMDSKGAAHASPVAQSLLRYGDYAQYKASGTRANGGITQDFATLMQRPDLTDFEKKWTARVATRQAVSFEQTLKDAQRIGAEATKAMSAPGFLRTLQREADLKMKLDQAETINRASDLILNSAFDRAWKALREEQHNDLEVAQLEAQLKEIDEARKSSSAMVQLLRDMVAVLNSSPKGQQLLSDPNVRRSDLIEAYRDFKQSAGQPIQAESLLNWGSFVLARAGDLRNDLVAAYYQQANPYVQHGLSHYERDLFQRLKKDPAGTIYQEIRRAKKRQSNEDKLRFTWWQLNRETMAKLSKLTGEVEAGMIATSTLNDPDYKSVTSQMFKEGELVGKGQVVRPYVDKILMTPSGKQVDISTTSMRGTGVRDKLWPQWEAARNEFIDHINNNPDDPNNPLHQAQLNALEEYYHDETTRSPHDRDNIWLGAADAVQEAFFRAGGSTAASGAKAVQKWSIVKERGAAQIGYDAPKLYLARDKTLFSHGIKTDMTGGKQPIEVVSRQFYGDHMNQFIYSLNRQTGPLKVGDTTLMGHTVTQADYDEAALQSDIYERAWKVVKDAFGGEDFHVAITDPRSGLTMTVTPVKGTRYFVARRFEPDQEPFANAFVESLNAETQARQAVNSNDPSVTPVQKADASARIPLEQKKQIDLLNAPGTWDKQLRGFVWDRNPDFAHPTPFDGPGKAFELAAPLTSRGQIKDFDQFIDFLTAHSAVPRDEAKAIVLTEWKRLINNIGKDEESPLVVDPKSPVKKNSFTRGRMEAHAPFTFYRYGLMDGSDLSALLGYIHSRALERVENGLVALRNDLDKRIIDLKAQSELSSRKKVINAREAEVRAGKNFDSYEDLNKRKGVVDRVLRYLADPDPEDKGDITWRRITGGATGAIVQNSMTTLQNMIGSWMFLGRLSTRLNSKPIFDYPAAFVYTFGQIPMAGFHVARAGVKAAAMGVAGMGRAVKEAQAAHNKGRRIRAFMSVPLENAIFELTEGMFKAYAPELVKHGINPLQNKRDDLRARMLLGWARGGRIGQQEMTGWQQFYHSIIGAAEIPMMISGSVLPTIGDLSQNKATLGMLANNPMSFKRSIQRALDKVHEARLRTFNWNDLKDPANTLSHKELGYFTKSGMEDAAVLLRESGLSLQTEAMKYLKAKHDGVPNPEFLTGESFTQFLDAMEGALNKATPANKAIIFEGANPIIKWIRPLLGWTVRTWNLMLRLWSGASHDQRKWMLRALVTTLGVIPFILGEAGAGAISDLVARWMSRIWYGKESNKKLPWEYDTKQQQALAMGKNMAYNVPFLATIMNTLLVDVPTRANATPSFVMLEKLKDLIGYAGGVVQTGNPVFGLHKVVTSFVPESRAILNRVPSEIGRVQGQDASALIRRYAPTDLVKPLQPAAVAGVLTEMSPYGNMLENQALRGDDQAFKQVYDEAVAKAKKLGLKDPEQRVRQSFLSRNPIDRVFKVKPTQRQLNDLMAGMSADEQAKVGQVMSNYRHAGSLIGADIEFTQEPSIPEIKMNGGLRNNLGQLPSFGRRGR